MSNLLKIYRIFRMCAQRNDTPEGTDFPIYQRSSEGRSVGVSGIKIGSVRLALV